MSFFALKFHANPYIRFTKYMLALYFGFIAFNFITFKYTQFWFIINLDIQVCRFDEKFIIWYCDIIINLYKEDWFSQGYVPEHPIKPYIIYDVVLAHKYTFVDIIQLENFIENYLTQFHHLDGKF
jgi:hypothetical protein